MQFSGCGGGGDMGVGGGGVVPSNYLVPTQLQCWSFCCWGCACCWAVTIGPLAYFYHSRRLCSIAAKHEQNKIESETSHADLLKVSDKRHVGT